MRAVHAVCLALMLGATAGCAAQSPTMPAAEVASVGTDGLIGAILENGITAQVNVSDIDSSAVGDDVRVSQKNTLRGKQNGITAQVNVSEVDVAAVGGDIQVTQKNQIRESSRRGSYSRRRD